MNGKLVQLGAYATEEEVDLFTPCCSVRASKRLACRAECRVCLSANVPDRHMLRHTDVRLLHAYMFRPCTGKTVWPCLLVQAAAVHDKAALHEDGSAAKLNFPRENYEEEARKLAGQSDGRSDATRTFRSN